MKIPSSLKSFIYKCDLFSVNVGFRFKQQREYASLTGGILSVIMIFFFIGIFTNTGLNTIRKNYIVASQNKKVYEDPSYLSLSKDKNFYFTMGLTGIDMNKDIRYFDITMTYTAVINGTKNKVKYPLVQCDREVWRKFDNAQLISSFDSLGLQKWLCPSENQIFQFQGKYSSQQFKYIKIGIQKCNLNTDLTRRCATKKRSFYSYISTYTAKTDNSLTPIQQNQQINGGITSQNAQIFPYYVTSTEYLKFYLRKSNQQILINRSFRKIDDTLSYIGGLFSSLITFLMIVCFYNELSYQLQIAKNIYRYDKQTLLDTNHFHFFNYIAYLFYLFLKKLNCAPNWQKMEQYDKSLLQVRKQMDVRLIFKKILFTQKLANAILSPQQLLALHLQDKITIDVAEQIRQNYYLPKKLLRELQNAQKKYKNPLSSRLNTENDQKFEDTSKSLRQEESIQNSGNQLKRKKYSEEIIFYDSLKDEIQKQRQYPKIFKGLTTLKINVDMITNSISNISQKENKSNEVYLKIFEAIKSLISKGEKQTQINKKILKGISPQIKQIFQVDKVSIQQSQMVKSDYEEVIEFKDSHSQNKFSKNQRSFRIQLKRKQNQKQIQQQEQNVSNIKRKLKFEQLKEINDIIVIEDYISSRQTKKIVKDMKNEQTNND